MKVVVGDVIQVRLDRAPQQLGRRRGGIDNNLYTLSAKRMFASTSRILSRMAYMKKCDHGDLLLVLGVSVEIGLRHREGEQRWHVLRVYSALEQVVCFVCNNSDKSFSSSWKVVSRASDTRSVKS